MRLDRREWAFRMCLSIPVLQIKYGVLYAYTQEPHYSINSIPIHIDSTEVNDDRNVHTSGNWLRYVLLFSISKAKYSVPIPR